MVASPEVCRANGRLSRGSVTTRGKAITSRNAERHGILAKLPPLLVTEALATFEGINEGLIDEYQPQTPTEHLLVQQIAVAWLRLYRVWGVEAAIANQAIVNQQRLSEYPARRHTDEESLLELAHGKKTDRETRRKPLTSGMGISRYAVLTACKYS